MKLSLAIELARSGQLDVEVVELLAQAWHAGWGSGFRDHERLMEPDYVTTRNPFDRMPAPPAAHACPGVARCAVCRA